MSEEIKTVHLFTICPLVSDSHGRISLSFRTDPCFAIGYLDLAKFGGLTMPLSLNGMICLNANYDSGSYCVAGVVRDADFAAFLNPQDLSSYMEPWMFGYQEGVVSLDRSWRLTRHEVPARGWGEELKTCSYGEGRYRFYAEGLPVSKEIGVLVLSYSVMWAPHATSPIALWKVAKAAAKGLENVSANVIGIQFSAGHADTVVTRVFPCLRDPEVWQFWQDEIMVLVSLCERYGNVNFQELFGDSHSEEWDHKTRFDTDSNDNNDEEGDHPGHSDEEDWDFDRPMSTVYAGEIMDLSYLVASFRLMPDEDSDWGDDSAEDEAQGNNGDSDRDSALGGYRILDDDNFQDGQM